MKKSLLLFSALLVLLFDAGAQKLEITAFTGYSFNSQANTYYGRYKVDNSQNYGGLIGVYISPGMMAEFLYNRTDTRVQYVYTGSPNPLDVGIEYYQLGGVQHFDIGSPALIPFGAVSLGATRFVLQDAGGDFTQTGDYWSFSAAIGGGLKIFPAEKIGFRLQARLGMPMSFNGIFFGIGTGGVSSGASFRVPIVMFDLSAGIILRL